MDKEDVVHIHNGILLSHKKWINAISSNMDGSRDCYTEWSKSDRKGEISYDIPYMQNLKRNYTNEFIYKTETENKLRGNQGEVWRGGIVKEFGIDMYTLLYLKWITNKALLYITRDLCSVSCGILDWRGVGREWIHGWVTLLSTWNNHNVANRPYSNIKLKVKKMPLSDLVKWRPMIRRVHKLQPMLTLTIVVPVRWWFWKSVWEVRRWRSTQRQLLTTKVPRVRNKWGYNIEKVLIWDK